MDSTGSSEMPVDSTDSIVTAEDNLTFIAPAKVPVLPIWRQGIVSGELFSRIMDYYQYVSTVCCFVGIIFSVINIVIYLYQSRNRRSSTSSGRRPAHVLFLIAVCFGDGMFTLAKAASTLYNVLFPGNSEALMYLHLYSNVYLSVSFRRAAIIVNALASLERFGVIAFPMSRASSLLQRRPHLVIAVVAVLSWVAHVYIFIEYKVIMTATGRYTLKRTEFATRHLDEIHGAKTTVRSIFFYFPLIASLLINFALMVALRRHAASKQSIRTTKGGTARDESSSNTSAEHQVAKFILIFTLTFVLLALPVTLNYTIGRFHPVYGILRKEHYLLDTVSKMADIPQFLTQLAIFLVSLRYNQRFRDTCTVLLGRLKAGGDRSGSNTYGISSSSSDVSSRVTEHSNGWVGQH